MLRSGMLHRCIRRKRGATIVEAAISSLLFFVALLMLIDLARLAYVSATLQYTVASSQRWAALRKGTSTLSREQVIAQRIRDRAAVLGVNLDTALINFCSYDANYGGSECVITNSGNTRQAMSISITYPLSIFLRTMTVNIVAKGEIINEPLFI